MPHPPQIPLTPQTDERNFPRWQNNPSDPKASGYGYPKMLTHPCTREERDNWVEKYRRVDRVTRDEYWEEKPPQLGSPIATLATQAMVDEGLVRLAGEPVIVTDKEHEIRVRAFLGILEPSAPVAKAVSIPIASQESYEAPTKAQEKFGDLPKKRRGRPPKAKASPPSEIVDELA